MPVGRKAHAKVPCRRCGLPVLPDAAAKWDGCCGRWYPEEKARRVRETRAATPPGCPVCEGKAARCCWFDWAEAQAGKGDYGKYPAHLQRLGGARTDETGHWVEEIAIP